MKYKVESNKKEVHIEISETEGKQDKLLAAFQKCQQGRCTCPTQEYSKLESLEIEHSDDTLRLKLKSKPGEKLGQTEIDKCLEHTTGKVMNE